MMCRAEILPETGKGTSEAGGRGGPQAGRPWQSPLYHLLEGANAPPPFAGEAL